MSVKPEEYTDEELKKAIEVLKAEMKKDKEVNFPTKEMIDGLRIKEEFLRRLVAEKTRRQSR